MKIEKINNWFFRRGQWVIKRRWWVIVAFVVLFAIGFYGLQFMNINDSWEGYFLEDDPVLLKTEEFKAVFGNDSYAAVMTDCDNTFTKENLELIRKLSNEMLDSMSYADKITSITDIEFMIGNGEGMSIEQIVPEEIPVDEAGLAEIRRKAMLKPHIASRLVSEDGRNTWVLLKLRPFPDEAEWRTGKGSIPPETLTGKELERIIEKEKYKPLNPKGMGLPYITDQKMQWIGKEMPRIMGLAILLAIVVLVFATRSLRGMVVPIITAIASIVITYGMLGYLRFTIDSGMILIPMLLAFAVAIAYNIHVHSYFRRQFQTHGSRHRAVEETVGEMGWPVLFSALTTFAALLSFLTIPATPMHFVGIATSTSVMLTFFIAITVMPAVLSFGKDRVPDPKVKAAGGGWLDRKLETLGKIVLKREKLMLSLFVLFAVFMIYQFTKIETAFDIESSMGRKVSYVKDILEVSESELGSIYSYDVMITLSEDGDAKLPQTLRALDTLQQIIDKYPLTKRTTSILNILKDLNQTLNDGDADYYSIPESAEEIAQQMLLYENAGGSDAESWIDYDYRHLRLQTEMKAYNSSEVEKELKDVSLSAQRLFPGAHVTPVGSMPQFTAMMNYVVCGQVTSFAISLLIIGLLMMIVFGNIRLGLIGLIPNIMPAITVGGLMGWLGYPLDMMTATIMPMILGLAVDDTIHFINHGHLEFHRQRNYRKAILRSFRIVGTPILLTTLVISANFAMYTTSQGRTMVNMGILSVVGILVALLADLCVTPLLFRRFRIFGKEDK